MQTVQLAIRNSGYASALSDVLAHSGPWHVERVDGPDAGETCVLVMDVESLRRAPLPLPHPELVVLIGRQNQESMSEAWKAGILSLVPADESPGTILLAIMSASLRLPRHMQFIH